MCHYLNWDLFYIWGINKTKLFDLVNRPLVSSGSFGYSNQTIIFGGEDLNILDGENI